MLAFPENIRQARDNTPPTLTRRNEPQKTAFLALTGVFDIDKKGDTKTN